MNDASDVANGRADFTGPLSVYAFSLGILGAVMGALKTPSVFWVILLLFAILLLVALMGQTEARRRGNLANTLRDARFTQIYRRIVVPRLERLWHGLCDPVAPQAGAIKTFWAALTWRLYYRAMLIAVVYPLLLLLAFWLWPGQEGKLGSAVKLPTAPLWPDRAMTFCVLALLPFSLLLRKWASASPKVFPRKVTGWLPVLAAALALAFAGAIAVILLDERGNGRLGRVLITAYVCVAVIGTTMLVDWSQIDDEARGIFLFLGILPLLNAFFDVLSYAATLTLIRRGLRAGFWAIGWTRL